MEWQAFYGGPWPGRIDYMEWQAFWQGAWTRENWLYGVTRDLIRGLDQGELTIGSVAGSLRLQIFHLLACDTSALIFPRTDYLPARSTFNAGQMKRVLIWEIPSDRSLRGKTKRFGHQSFPSPFHNIKNVWNSLCKSSIAHDYFFLLFKPCFKLCFF